MQIFSQNDLRWKNSKIGFDTGPSDTVGNYGCYMTSIANVCSWAGNDLTPQQINDLCIQNGWLVSSDLISRDDVPSLLCSNLTFDGKTTWHDATSMNFFDDASDPNIAYIICIDASNAPGIQTHFVMVEKTLGGGDLQIADSWDGVSKPLSKYGNPSVIIQSATKFSRTHTIVESALSAVTPPYSLSPIPSKLVTIRTDTHRWNVTIPDLPTLLSRPVSAALAGEGPIEVNQLCQHQNGITYYIPADGSLSGYDVADCDDYIPPTPKPYVPPAAPVVVPPAHRYTLKTTMMTFPTAQDALSGSNAVATLRPRTYYVWEENGKAYQLGEDNQHRPEGNWVNILYNKADEVKPVKVEPLPQPKPTALKPSQVKVGDQSDNSWKSSYKAFYHDGHSDLYEVKQHLTMLDYSGKRNPVAVQPGDQVNVTGTFLKDGVMFYRTRSARDEFFSWYYGIPLYDDYGSIQIIKVVDMTPKITLKNIAYWVADDLRRWWDIKIKKEK